MPPLSSHQSSRWSGVSECRGPSYRRAQRAPTDPQRVRQLTTVGLRWRLLACVRRHHPFYQGVSFSVDFEHSLQTVLRIAQAILWTPTYGNDLNPCSTRSPSNITIRRTAGHERSRWTFDRVVRLGKCPLHRPPRGPVCSRFVLPPVAPQSRCCRADLAGLPLGVRFLATARAASAPTGSALYMHPF